jgi:hypothetical protein
MRPYRRSLLCTRSVTPRSPEAHCRFFGDFCLHKLAARADTRFCPVRANGIACALDPPWDAQTARLPIAEAQVDCYNRIERLHHAWE